MKRLIYVYTAAGVKPGSVQTKVINQIKALNQDGVVCKGLFFTTDEAEHLSNEFYEFIKVPRIGKVFFRSFKQKKAYHQAVKNYLFNNGIQADYYYFRYPGSSPQLSALAKALKKKIIFEHVTAEVPEHKLYARYKPFEWNVSNILGRIEFLWIPVLQEKLFGRGIRKRALFGIANSQGIADYENQVSGSEYVRLISGDAVNTSDFKIRTPELSKDEFNLIFLKGAVTEADFNGLDRVFNGIKQYRGEKKLKMYLFGSNLVSEKEMVRKLGIESNVHFGDFVNKQEIDELINHMHIGISALGVHRKGIRDTTTIKSREYTARGLPFVYGHIDPDFSFNPTAKMFSYQIAGEDTPLNFEEILNWYQKLDVTGVLSTMRNYSETWLDYKIKMKKILDLLP